MVFHLPPFDIKTVSTGDGTVYQRLYVFGYARPTRPGIPEIPFTGMHIDVPAENSVSCEILSAAHKTVTVPKLYPVPNIEFAPDSPSPIQKILPNPDAYRSDDFTPEQLIRIRGPAACGQKTLAGIHIYPFAWNPKSAELRCYHKIRFRLRFEPATKAPDAERRAFVQEPSAAPTGATAVKIRLKNENVYRISSSDLLNAGVPIDTVDPDTLQLFNEGVEKAIHVSVGSGGSLASGGCVDFYGQAVNSRYTATNVYWLYWGLSVGKRISTVSGSLTDPPAVPPASFSEELHLEENRTPWTAMPDADENDFWFWKKLTAPTELSIPVEIPDPAAVQDVSFLQVFFRGVSTAAPAPNHHTRVYINDVPVGDDAWWDGDIAFVQQIPLTEAHFQAGTNTIRIELPDDTGAAANVVYLDRLKIVYQREFKAIGNRLRFSVSGNGPVPVKITGIDSNAAPRLFDVSDPDEPVEISGFVQYADGSDPALAFEAVPAGSPKTFLILPETDISAPPSIEPWQSPNLRSSENSADYLLITDPEFTSAAGPLLELRTAQGLRTKAVATVDIYNEFSFGRIDPEAIHAFLQYAYENWAPPKPEYVLLLGDANLDYHDYLETGKVNRVPPHLEMLPVIGMAPVDAWYTAVSGDDRLPDIHIGRLPAASADAVEAVVKKLIAYETGRFYPKSVLFVADDEEDEEDESAFERFNDQLAQNLPARFAAEKVYLSGYPEVNDATEDIIGAINTGQLLTLFHGHGSVTNWAGEIMFQNADVYALENNGRSTAILALTCLNGYFAQPYNYSLSETVVAAPGKGAVAAISTSGLGYTWEQQIVADAFFSAVFQDSLRTLGKLMDRIYTTGFARGIDPIVLQSYVLIGDPATRLNVPAPPGDINLDGTVALDDAIQALQILSSRPNATPRGGFSADSSGNGSIGVEEVLYILNLLGG